MLFVYRIKNTFILIISGFCVFVKIDDDDDDNNIIRSIMSDSRQFYGPALHIFQSWIASFSCFMLSGVIFDDV